MTDVIQPPATLPPGSLAEADYEAIEEAVMETARGRWFLAEYARRNRHTDTTAVLDAIGRLEGALAGARPVSELDRVRVDIREMAHAIARTKAEIAAIKPEGAVAQSGRFDDASVELDAIVQATETATGDILSAAETVQEIAWTLRESGADGEVCDLIDTKATDIYTACSFQDITGQRTRKVIGVLRFLEERIDAMMAIWGEPLVTPLATPPLMNEAPKPAAEDTTLLNGPARPGEGLEQSDVDLMLDDALFEDVAPSSAEAVEDPEPFVAAAAQAAEPLPVEEPIVFAQSEPVAETALEFEAEPEVEPAAAVTPAALVTAGPVAAEPAARPEPITAPVAVVEPPRPPEPVAVEAPAPVAEPAPAVEPVPALTQLAGPAAMAPPPATSAEPMLPPLRMPVTETLTTTEPVPATARATAAAALSTDDLPLAETPKAPRAEPLAPGLAAVEEIERLSFVEKVALTS